MIDYSNIESWVRNLGPIPATLIVCNFIGWQLKRSPRFPSWLIPWFMFGVGGILYPFLCEDGTAVWNSNYPEATTIVIGLCIGGAAVGMYEGISNFLGRKDAANITKMPDSASNEK